MKRPDETEEEFQARVQEAKSKGICIFRNDQNREMILDIIDTYIDVYEAVYDDRKGNY